MNYTIIIYLKVTHFKETTVCIKTFWHHEAVKFKKNTKILI